ncbi:hypothetical protein C8Q80DRAFT_441970 [Daedaleopsis nitida]|nr:hypothetical protein C8Q80DRAFT_441970 [Daedaleopsis nitida]
MVLDVQAQADCSRTYLRCDDQDATDCHARLTCHSAVTQSSPNRHPIVTQSSPNCHPIVTQLSPNRHPIVTQLSLNWHPIERRALAPHRPAPTRSRLQKRILVRTTFHLFTDPSELELSRFPPQSAGDTEVQVVTGPTVSAARIARCMYTLTEDSTDSEPRRPYSHVIQHSSSSAEKFKKHNIDRTRPLGRFSFAGSAAALARNSMPAIRRPRHAAALLSVRLLVQLPSHGTGPPRHDNYCESLRSTPHGRQSSGLAAARVQPAASGLTSSVGYVRPRAAGQNAQCVSASRAGTLCPA